MTTTAVVITSIPRKRDGGRGDKGDIIIRVYGRGTERVSQREFQRVKAALSRAAKEAGCDVRRLYVA